MSRWYEYISYKELLKSKKDTCTDLHYFIYCKIKFYISYCRLVSSVIMCKKNHHEVYYKVSGLTRDNKLYCVVLNKVIPNKIYCDCLQMFLIYICLRISLWHTRAIFKIPEHTYYYNTEE